MGIIRKIERRFEDNEYKKLLASHINCETVDLYSIVGANELEDLLSRHTYDNYSVGNNFENTENGLFKVNLHMHTTDSDGNMSIEDLLNQSVEYANRMSEPPYIFAVTNHDVLEDTKKAIEILSRESHIYKNIRFVPGIELSAKYENPELFNNPVQLEIIGYSINPFDRNLNDFLYKKHQENFEYAEYIIKEANKYGLSATLSEAKEYHNLLYKGASPAFMPLLGEYLILNSTKNNVSKLPVRNILMSHTDTFGSHLLTPATPSFEELFNVINTGFLGIAHPGRLGLENLKPGISFKDALLDIFKHFKSLGGKALEVHYQYPGHFFTDDTNRWHSFINECADKLNFYKTGGIDNHSNSIFICKS